MRLEYCNSISLVSLTSSKMTGLALELVEVWINAFKIKEENVVIGSDIRTHSTQKYRICYGENFSERLLACLDNINTDYVLLILDDYKLLRLDIELFNKVFNFMGCYDAKVLRLVPVPKPNVAIPGNEFCGICSNETHWRINTQPAIYQKKYLQRLIYGSENLWEFEVNSCIRALGVQGNILSPYAGIVDFREIVKGGKIFSRYYSEYGKKYQIEKIGSTKELFIVMDGNIKRIIIELFGYTFAKKISRVLLAPFRMINNLL